MEDMAHLQSYTILSHSLLNDMIDAAAGGGSGLAGIKACTCAALAGSGHSRLAYRGWQAEGPM